MKQSSILNLAGETRMLDAVRAGLDGADDVSIAVSFTRHSGLGLLHESLAELGAQKKRVRLLTSTYMGITQPDALQALLEMEGVETRVQSGKTPFHTKFWWFKNGLGSECWVGSSNLTKGGLTNNLEWNLRSIDPPMVAQTQAQFEGLWGRSDVRPVSTNLIEEYRKVFLEQARQSFDLKALEFSDQSPDVISKSNSIQPNEAQREALKQIAQMRQAGARRAAIIAATGVGKTYLAAFDAKQMGAKRILFVSHRLEHLSQALRSFKRVLVGTHSFGVVADGQNGGDADVVFATVASLRARPELRARPWDYLIIDEFHHVEAKSYEILRPIREKAFLLGLTATPERQDDRDILEWCDWNVAYEVRLESAIERKWILPFHYFGVADEAVEFPDLRRLSNEEMEELLSTDARVDEVLKKALAYGYDGPKRVTVGFCAGRKHAAYMAKAFNARGHAAISVTGEVSVDQREAIYGQLADLSDPLSWLFVADVLNEGVDLPAINSVLFLRPTESATLFLQQLGRGLRIYPGTEMLTVLDFVGHHRASWLPIQALANHEGTGREVEIAEGIKVRPPEGCEIVLERKTKEILEKVAKVQKGKETRKECLDAYARVRKEVGRPLLPINFWGRLDVPSSKRYRDLYKAGWVVCQRDANDEPAWAKGLDDAHPAFAFLRCVEKNWQAQRVAPYALAWGMCQHPSNPAVGYEAFFEKWPHLSVEKVDLASTGTWDAVREQLGNLLVSDRLSPEIIDALKEQLLPEVEGRLLPTIQGDYQTRHCGVLRAPEDLKSHALYSRPQIVNHFGVQYDPARHNTGLLWFGNEGVIIVKLDTSGAKEIHQYKNEFIDAKTFAWTSQNRMTPENDAGRRVIAHEKEGRRLYLFVQGQSHEAAEYMGQVRVIGFEGSGPMRVKMQLGSAIQNHQDVAAKTPEVSDARPAVLKRIPYFDLYAAAGVFSEAQDARAADRLTAQHVSCDEPKVGPNHFAMRIHGRSMEPAIPDGSLALFVKGDAVGGSRQNGVFLFALNDAIDPETNSRLTVKRYYSEKAHSGGLWQHTRVELRPDNPAFKPIVVSEEDHGVRCVAKFVKILPE